MNTPLSRPVRQQTYAGDNTTSFLQYLSLQYTCLYTYHPFLDWLAINRLTDHAHININRLTTPNVGTVEKSYKDNRYLNNNKLTYQMHEYIYINKGY